MTIGICGKSGSGKSTLSKMISESNGGIHLDIDKIGHKVLLNAKVQEELIECFGKGIINSNNIDRKKLGEIVFASRQEMKKLSDITWKYMQVEIDEFLNQNKDKTVILDWILLPITKYFDMCDVKILLDVPYEVRKQRSMKRDNISEEDFVLREGASIDLSVFNFDYVIDGDENKVNVRKLVKNL